MAINVNTVYRTCLFIINKEQRGYLTPAEFNSIATQVQLEVFEKYFEDKNQQLRLPENESEYANRVKNVDNQISIFKEITSLAPDWIVGTNEFNQPANVHRIGTVIYKDEQELQRVERNDWLRINMSKLTRPSANYPIYIYESDKIIIQPPSLVVPDPLNPAQILDQFSLSYVRKPLNPVWSYTVQPSNGAFIYDSLTSQDFEIDDVDQTEVILKVLLYAGVVIRDPQIVQAAAGHIAAEDQNEKT